MGWIEKIEPPEEEKPKPPKPTHDCRVPCKSIGTWQIPGDIPDAEVGSKWQCTETLFPGRITCNRMWEIVPVIPTLWQQIKAKFGGDELLRKKWQEIFLEEKEEE